MSPGTKLHSHAALLRAVNIGSYNKVPMSGLRDLAATLGLREPKTLLQSGNLVFADPAERMAAELERLLEQALAETFGVRTDVFVRSGADLARVIANNPFPREAKKDPSHLLVAFQKEGATPDQVAALQAAIVGREQVRGAGRELYLVYPEGIGRSKLTTAVTAKYIKSPGTARNWNTVLKLAALLG